MQAELAEGYLARLPAESCAGAELWLARQGGSWEFRLRRGALDVQHAVAELGSVQAWVESWLAPPSLPVAPAPRSGPPASEKRDIPARLERTTARLARSPAPQLGVLGLVDIDAYPPVSPGAELAFRTGVAHSLWFGVGATFVRGADRGEVERQALRLSARLGWVHVFSWGAILPAIGLGVASGQAWRKLPGGSVIREDAAGPFVELSMAFDVPLAAGLSLGIGAQGRAHMPDDLGPDDDSPGELLEPDSLPDVAASLGVGFSWAFGGAS